MNILKIMTLAGLGAGMMACASSKQKVEVVSLTGRWDIVAVAGCDSVAAEREPFIDFVEGGSLNGCGSATRSARRNSNRAVGKRRAEERSCGRRCLPLLSRLVRRCL